MSSNAAFTSGLAVMLMLSSVKTQQVIPSQYVTFQLDGVPSANGSSPTGHCSNATFTTDLIPTLNVTTCTAPSSSVLFDGIIPTLTGLNGNMWASQLLTLYTLTSLAIVHFDFNSTVDYAGVDRVEVVLVNCPVMGITVERIELYSPSTLYIPSTNTPLVISAVTPVDTSCDSLVTVHIPCEDTRCNNSLLGLHFRTPRNSTLVYVAGIKFYDPDNYPTPQQDTTRTSLSPDMTSILPATAVEVTVPNAQFPSCSTPTILASVITAISTALLATVIFVLVQIALCKCRPKATPGGAESAPSAGGEGLAVYEQVDVVALSDPTYMEIGAGGKGGGAQNIMELEENKAYGAFLASQN